MNTQEVKQTFLNIDTSAVVSESLKYLEQQGIPYELHGHIQTVAKHRVEILLPGLVFNDGTSNLTAKLCLSNANNGTRAFHIAVGFIRAVCSNGLVVGVNAFSERIIHRNTPNTVARVNELPMKIAKAFDYLQSGEAVDTVLELRNQAIAEHQAIEIIASLNVKDAVKQSAINVWLQPERRRAEDQENNLYNLYNVVNERLRREHGQNLTYHTANDRLLDDMVFLANNI